MLVLSPWSSAALAAHQPGSAERPAPPEHRPQRENTSEGSQAFQPQPRDRLTCAYHACMNAPVIPPCPASTLSHVEARVWLEIRHLH